MRARVTVYPRPEILDPQGKAIKGALEGIGFHQVEDVRAGKSFDIVLDADDDEHAGDLLDSMCSKLLANTVVEDYEIELMENGGDDGGPRE